MISGRQTLASIDQALDRERGKIDSIQGEIQTQSDRLLEQQRADAMDFRELARLRVDLLGSGELVRHLDQAEAQVVSLLQQRAAATEELAQRLVEAETTRQDLDEQRAARASDLDHALEQLDEAESQTQARLDAVPAYQAQQQRAQEAERTARHADAKAKQSGQELEQKGRAYREDPLFMYLWGRHYGLPQYRASSLIRWLDGKVAKLIGFADARANYARLNEIPVRLREHAERLEAAAAAEHQRLKELDLQGREADGIPALQRTVEDAQTALDATDERLETAEAERQALVAKQAAFASGDDEHTRKAVQYLAAELQQDDLMELRREALDTPLPDDDLVVARIRRRQRDRTRLETAIASMKQAIGEHQTRLNELQTLRIDFKRNRYDRPDSAFGDGSLVTLMIGNFLEGLLDRRNLWRILQDQQRYRPRRADPTFGSGGLGRGTVWGGGLGDLRDLGDIFGGFGGGRPGGGGGGGFRTGGGF